MYTYLKVTSEYGLREHSRRRQNHHILPTPPPPPPPPPPFSTLTGTHWRVHTLVIDDQGCNRDA